MTARVCYRKLKQVPNEESKVKFYMGDTVTFNENVKVIVYDKDEEYCENDKVKSKISKIITKLFGITNPKLLPKERI